MTDQYLTVRFTTEASRDAAFAAITNPRGWWGSDVTGDAIAVDDEFTYIYQDKHRSTQRVTELVPGQRVVWHVVNGYLNFTADPAEWTGTDVVFDIEPVDGGSAVRMTYVGLTPDTECFEACIRGWRFYVGEKLPELIAAGVSA
jgi:hypothetical protein